MHKIILLFLAVAAFTLALPAFAFGENSLTLIEWEGKYQELEKMAESRLTNVAARDTSTIAPLCVAYSKLKKYNKLMSCLDELETLVKSGDRSISADVAFVPSSDAAPLPNALRAEAYMELAEYSKALEEGIKALGKIKPELFSFGEIWSNPRYRIQILSTLALVSAILGDRENAKKYIAELEKVSLPLANGDIWGSIRKHGIGKTYIAMSEYQSAIKYLRREGFFDKRARNEFTVMIDLARDLMLAKAYLEIGNLVESKDLLDGLLANPRLIDQGDIQWVTLFERGRIAQAEEKTVDAIGYYRRAVELVELQRATIYTEASKIGFVGDKQDVYKKLIVALVQTTRLAEAFDYLERSKSRALVDMLASKKDFSVHEGDATKIHELLAKVEQTEMDALAQGIAPAGANPQAATSSATVSGQRSLAVSAVKQVMADAAPELLSLVSVSSTPIEEIQARIPEDEVLVEYYYDDKSLFIFLLSRQGLQAVRTEVGGLNAEVTALRDAIAAPKSEAYLPIAQQLYQQLVKPIEPLLAGRSKLIIVPQGVLHYVPFAALYDGSQFLLDKYAFRLLPSASVVKYLRDQQTRKPGGIFAFGNPDLGDSKYDLRFAEEEAKAIIQTVPKSRAVLRKEANETVLRENVTGFNYLHFATHGKFNADTPLDSALILAKDATSDGLLTVSKLYSMRLDIDLATLSACETGLGKIANGDDVVGLTRGFLFAGASTIVASLWQVDDQATSDLMLHFYEGLKNKDKREALRQAQFFARKKYAHPYYWAAFQLTGNSQ